MRPQSLPLPKIIIRAVIIISASELPVTSWKLRSTVMFNATIKLCRGNRAIYTRQSRNEANDKLSVNSQMVKRCISPLIPNSSSNICHRDIVRYIVVQMFRSSCGEIYSCADCVHFTLDCLNPSTSGRYLALHS